MEFAINNSVHASTGETPFYVNGLRHPRSPVSFVHSPSLSGGGLLTSLEANAQEGNSLANILAETNPDDPAKVAVVSVESRQDVPVLQDDNAMSLLAAKTHERPPGGVIGELDAKSASEARRFVDERLAITCKSVTPWQAHRTSRNNMRIKMVAKTMNALVYETKYY